MPGPTPELIAEMAERAAAASSRHRDNGYLRGVDAALGWVFGRLMWAFECFAAELIGSFTDKLWHALEDERPVWPEVIRGLCHEVATIAVT